MHRRKFLGLFGLGTCGTVLSTASVTGRDESSGDSPSRARQTTTNPEGTCYNADEDYTYPCHNTDENADGLDTFYVKAWTGDASNRVEIDFTNDFAIRYQFYIGGYGSDEVRGYIENTSERTLEAIEVTATSFTEDDETGEHIPVERNETFLGDLNPGLKYPYDVSLYTNWTGQYSVFELWVQSA